MKKWEYVIIDSMHTDRGKGLRALVNDPGIDQIENYLNKLGLEGWEVVNIDFVDELLTNFRGLAKRERN